MSPPKAKRLSQEERTALSDRRLLAAAVDLIVKRGTEKTTLRALGEVSGYSRGLVTYRYGSKSGLFIEVIKQVSEDWLAAMEASVLGRTGVDALVTVANTFHEFVSESPKDLLAMRILMHQAAEPGSELAPLVSTIHRRQRERVADWIRAGQDNGSVRAELDADTSAARFCAQITGMTLFWSIDRDYVDWEAAHRHYIESLTRELAAH